MATSQQENKSSRVKSASGVANSSNTNKKESVRPSTRGAISRPQSRCQMVQMDENCFMPMQMMPMGAPQFVPSMTPQFSPNMYPMPFYVPAATFPEMVLDEGSSSDSTKGSEDDNKKDTEKDESENDNEIEYENQNMQGQYIMAPQIVMNPVPMFQSPMPMFPMQTMPVGSMTQFPQYQGSYHAMTPVAMNTQQFASPPPSSQPPSTNNHSENE